MFNEVRDITHPISSDLAGFPGDAPFSREHTCRIADGDVYDLSRITLSSHCGTHLDAPSHLFLGGRTIDSYPACDMIMAAMVVEVDDPVSVKPESVYLAEKIFTEVSGHDCIFPRGGALLFKTRNSLCLGRQPDGHSDPVFISDEAALACVELGLRLVGIDSLSADRITCENLPVHKILLSAGVLILEDTMLSLVPGGLYTLICLPMLIMRAEASPVRAILVR